MAPSTTERLWTAIEERQDELVALVAELVRRPSTIGDEAEAQAFVADHLRASGCETDVWEVDEEVKRLPDAGDSGVPFAGRPNVTGVLRGTGGGRSLILNGHIDVVSPAPVEDWTHDPWGAEIVGDRMYGRGACDMKSGIALQLFLTRLLNDLDLRPRGDLIVQSVIEEECTGNGALAASRRDRADSAIVTEPTGGNLPYAHLGLMWFRVAVAGRAAHAGNASEGVNAIVKMQKIIDALLALEARLNVRLHPAYRDQTHPLNLIIGTIRGGDWPSTVPGTCELHCRLGFFPGQEVAEVAGLVEDAVREAAMRDDWMRDHPPAVVYDGFHTRGVEISLDTPPLRLLRAWHTRVTGTEPRAHAMSALTDMRYFHFAGIPSGVYGAAGRNAHADDEYLDLASLVPAAKVLGAFALDWCGGAA